MGGEWCGAGSLFRCGHEAKVPSSQRRLDLRVTSDALFCCEKAKTGLVLSSDRVLELHVV